MASSKAFDRILIVMLENQYRRYAMQDPFMAKLARAGCDLQHFFGAFHPSQTNYVASIAGEVCGLTQDDLPEAPLPQATIVDLMQPIGERLRVDWKAYMEGYPGETWNAAWSKGGKDVAQPMEEYPNSPELARYYRKHNAFATFKRVQADADRWGRIVGDIQFWNDVESGDWPKYAWFTPDIWNDGHYLYNTHIQTNPRVPLVAQSSAWLEYCFFGNVKTNKLPHGDQFGQKTIGLNLDVNLLLDDPRKAYEESNIPTGTLVVVTFDEADFDATLYDTCYDGPNQIYTVLLGDMITPGATCTAPLNHYGLLRTVEVNFGLPSLGKNDRGANYLRCLWGEEFGWSQPESTPLESVGSIAVAGHDGVFHAVLQDAQGRLSHTVLDGSWSSPNDTGLATMDSAPDHSALSRPVALTSDGSQLVLVGVAESGLMFVANWRRESGWSEPQSLPYRTFGSLALTSFVDEDGVAKLLLAWQGDEHGFIFSAISVEGNWPKTPIPVGQLTDGNIQAAQVGSSLYLVYKKRNARGMRMTSMNLGAFNQISAIDWKGHPATCNDTSKGVWSAMDFGVSYLSKQYGSLDNDYLAEGQLALAAIDGEMHLAHKVAMPDKNVAFTEAFGFAGVMTAGDAASNGYGTLDQAGWTKEQQLDGVTLSADSPIAMGSTGDELLLLYQPHREKLLSFITGKYQGGAGRPDAAATSLAGART